MGCTLDSSGFVGDNGSAIYSSAKNGIGSYWYVYYFSSGGATTMFDTTSGAGMMYTYPGVGNFNAGNSGTWRLMGWSTDTTAAYDQKQLYVRVS
jgi:hypothetical protein